MALLVTNSKKRRSWRIQLLAALMIAACACGGEDLGEVQLQLSDGAGQAVELVSFLHSEERYLRDGAIKRLYTEAEVHFDPQRSHTMQLDVQLPRQGDLPPTIDFYEQHEGDAPAHFRTTAAQVLWRDNILTDCACQGVRIAAEFQHAGPDGRDNTDDDLYRRIDDALFFEDNSSCVPLTEPETIAGVVELDRYQDCRVIVQPAPRYGDSDYDVERPVVSTGVGVVFVDDYDDDYYDDDYYDDDYYDDDYYDGSGNGGCESDSSSGCESDDSESTGCGDSSSGGSGCESDDAESTACGSDSHATARHPLSGAGQNYLLIGLSLTLIRPRRRSRAQEATSLRSGSGRKPPNPDD